MGTRIEITPSPGDKPETTAKSVGIGHLMSGIFRRLPVLNGRQYTVVSGPIKELGTLQTLTSFNTKNTGGTYGRFSVVNPVFSASTELPMFSSDRHSGSFWALRRDYSRTSPQESHSISLLKVGGSTFTDLNISQRAIFEILGKGDEVAVIVAERTTNLLAVRNKTRELIVGNKESFLGYFIFAFILLALILFSGSPLVQLTSSILLILTIKSWLASKAAWKVATKSFMEI